jgi:hypothetical protein
MFYLFGYTGFAGVGLYKVVGALEQETRIKTGGADMDRP